MKIAQYVFSEFKKFEKENQYCSFEVMESDDRIIFIATNLIGERRVIIIHANSLGGGEFGN